jgi:hypothetical protein
LALLPVAASRAVKLGGPFTAAAVRFVRIAISAVPYDHVPAINEVRFYAVE